MFSIKACFQHVFYNMRKIVLLLRLIRVGWFVDKRVIPCQLDQRCKTHRSKNCQKDLCYTAGGIFQSCQLVDLHIYYLPNSRLRRNWINDNKNGRPYAGRVLASH